METLVPVVTVETQTITGLVCSECERGALFVVRLGGEMLLACPEHLTGVVWALLRDLED